jgi:hypothetical protein
LFVQVPLQHSALAKHVAPWGLQTFGPQKPLEHWKSQHSCGASHAVPWGLHSMPPQKPRKQSWSQHSAGSAHAVPWGLHSAPPQKPLRQSNSQQSTVISQAVPSGAQICVGLQRPSLQSLPSQQSPSTLQLSPRSPHSDPPLAA